MGRSWGRGGARAGPESDWVCVSGEEGTWPGKEAGDSPRAPDLPFSGTGACVSFLLSCNTNAY